MTTPDARTAAPQRTCIGCRQTRPQSDLVRCTVSPQGAHVSRTAAGRGAWLCSMNCYQTAVQRKAFDRSWKQSVPVATLLTLGDSLRDAFNETVFQQDIRESSVVGITLDEQTPRKG